MTSRVFISYSQDAIPADHGEQVHALAEKLRSEGVEVMMDRYDPNPIEGWPQWMIRQIRENDFVLCVCTANYALRFENAGPLNEGRGARLEGHIITTEIFLDACQNKKFIPILFPHSRIEDIPILLRDTTHYRLYTQYDLLYARLTGQEFYRKQPIGETHKVVARAPDVPTQPPRDKSDRRRTTQSTSPKTMESKRWSRSDVMALVTILVSLVSCMAAIYAVSPWMTPVPPIPQPRAPAVPEGAAPASHAVPLPLQRRSLDPSLLNQVSRLEDDAAKALKDCEDKNIDARRSTAGLSATQQPDIEAAKRDVRSSADQLKAAAVGGNDALVQGEMVVTRKQISVLLDACD